MEYLSGGKKITKRLYTYQDLWDMYHSEVVHGKRLMLELKALKDEYKKLEKAWEGKDNVR